MQDRLLDMQIAAPLVGTCPGAVERLRADHEPRGGDAAGPRDRTVAWVARSVHEIPNRLRPRIHRPLRPRFAPSTSRGSATADPVTTALPAWIHTVRDDLE